MSNIQSVLYVFEIFLFVQLCLTTRPESELYSDGIICLTGCRINVEASLDKILKNKSWIKIINLSILTLFANLNTD